MFLPFSACSVILYFERYLKTIHFFPRFGLYGSPLDPELFDMDLPPILKSPTSGSSSGTMPYRISNTADSIVNPNAGGGSQGDDQDFRDLLTLSVPGKDAQAGNTAKANADTLAKNVCGLLEVEPLHFTCNSTSDSTKLERADTGEKGVVMNSSQFSDITSH